MTKATLHFTFPEDRDAFEQAIKGDHYYRALEDIRDAFRSKAKYAEEETTTWSEVRDLFWETLKEAGIELD